MSDFIRWSLKKIASFWIFSSSWINPPGPGQTVTVIRYYDNHRHVMSMNPWLLPRVSWDKFKSNLYRGSTNEAIWRLWTSDLYLVSFERWSPLYRLCHVHAARALFFWRTTGTFPYYWSLIVSMFLSIQSSRELLIFCASKLIFGICHLHPMLCLGMYSLAPGIVVIKHTSYSTNG